MVAHSLPVTYIIPSYDLNKNCVYVCVCGYVLLREGHFGKVLLATARNLALDDPTPYKVAVKKSLSSEQ